MLTVKKVFINAFQGYNLELCQYYQEYINLKATTTHRQSTLNDKVPQDTDIQQPLLSVQYQEPNYRLPSCVQIDDSTQEIIHINKSVVDLHDLFKNMQFFIDQQSSLSDRIDHNINQSLDIHIKTIKQVKKTMRKAKVNGKIKIYVCIAVFLLVLIITLCLFH